MNILITGCAGFIGARTTQLAVEAGHEVTGIDNLNNYYDIRVKNHRLNLLKRNENFSFEQIDIEDGDKLDRLFSRQSFDAVINLAARAGVRASIEDPEVYLRTNTMGTLNLLTNLLKYEVPKLVIASTSSLYAGQPMPFCEDALVTRPISPYSASKLAAEALCHVWHHLHDLDVSVLRYFTVYGAAGRPDMAPFRFSEWIRRGEPIKLYGDGTQTRDFTHIDDIAHGTLAALKPLGYEIINLGGGNEPLSINAMISILEKKIGRTANIHYEKAVAADMQDTAADVGKAKKLLNWVPEVSPLAGLNHTAEWHMAEAGWLGDVNL